MGRDRNIKTRKMGGKLRYNVAMVDVRGSKSGCKSLKWLQINIDPFKRASDASDMRIFNEINIRKGCRKFRKVTDNIFNIPNVVPFGSFLNSSCIICHLYSSQFITVHEVMPSPKCSFLIFPNTFPFSPFVRNLQ